MVRQAHQERAAVWPVNTTRQYKRDGGPGRQKAGKIHFRAAPEAAPDPGSRRQRTPTAEALTPMASALCGIPRNSSGLPIAPKGTLPSYYVNGPISGDMAATDMGRSVVTGQKSTAERGQHEGSSRVISGGSSGGGDAGAAGMRRECLGAARLAGRCRARAGSDYRRWRGTGQPPAHGRRTDRDPLLAGLYQPGADRRCPQSQAAADGGGWLRPL